MIWAFADSYQIMMPIFAHQSAFDTLSDCSVIFTYGRDVDEESSISVNPSAIYYVQLVFGRSIGIVRIDLKQVVASRVNLWQTEMVLRHVVIFGQKGYSRFGDLHVDIRVPW